MRKKKICVVIGSAMNLHSLYKDQFKFLQENGYEITGVAPDGIEHEWLQNDGIRTKIIHLKRPPSPVNDLWSLLQLSWFFMFNRFDIVSISTPKASLIGALAASLTFQKKIMYTLRGRAYEMETGWKRKFYETIEKFVCAVSVKVFCISHELKDDVIKSGICKKEKIFVIGSGSSNGVDLIKFNLSLENLEQGRKVRKKLGLKREDLLILYSGRIRKDKGINELVLAFNRIALSRKNVFLLIQGKYDHFDSLTEEVLFLITKHPRIFQEGWKRNTEKFYAAADIFAFPSHREGFGNVALEASAMELPVIGFNVIGCRESISHGVSGLLIDEINSTQLEIGLVELIEKPKLRKELGRKGRCRIESEFDSKILWRELLNSYNNIIHDDN
ncbi:glycosyltransferase family 4 protein [Christiangramia marina]|uniref:glycosyltransferase family 4 protein n=1 Tax=Christiangramia marina TaxID=409436 RepID=UPI003AA990F3